MVSKRLKDKGLDIVNTRRIISVDLFEMAPIEGCTMLQGDITREKTVQEIQSLFANQEVQLVISDGAPDILGDHDFD